MSEGGGGRPLAPADRQGDPWMPVGEEGAGEEEEEREVENGIGSAVDVTSA